MYSNSARQPLPRLTAAILVAVMLVSGTIAPAASALRCQNGCDTSVDAVDSSLAPAFGRPDDCCRVDICHAPRESQEEQDSQKPHKHRADCCPVSCAGCIARPIFVAPSSIPAVAEPVLRFAPMPPAGAADALDVAFSIFHPPKA